MTSRSCIGTEKTANGDKAEVQYREGSIKRTITHGIVNCQGVWDRSFVEAVLADFMERIIRIFKQNLSEQPSIQFHTDFYQQFIHYCKVLLTEKCNPFYVTVTHYSNI